MKNAKSWWRKPFVFHTWKWYNWLAFFLTTSVLLIAMRLAEGVLFHDMRSLGDIVQTATVSATGMTAIYYFYLRRVLRP